MCLNSDKKATLRENDIIHTEKKKHIVNNLTFYKLGLRYIDCL